MEVLYIVAVPYSVPTKHMKRRRKSMLCIKVDLSQREKVDQIWEKLLRLSVDQWPTLILIFLWIFLTCHCQSCFATLSAFFSSFIFWATCLNLRSAQRNRSWKWNSANSTTCNKMGIEERALDERAKLCEIFHLGWDKVEDSLALEHVEVCLHLLKVGEALVLEEGVDGGEHLLQDLPRLAQPTFSTLLSKILNQNWPWKQEWSGEV